MDPQTAELRQDLQRYASQFAERVTEVMSRLEQSSRGVSDRAMERNLLYVGSALDIASGPLPEVNLLDMAVFVRLSRKVVDEYWVPQVYGPEGAEVASVFAESEEELWQLVQKVLDPARRGELEQLIDQWRTDHAGQIRVEGIRLADFSEHAGRAAAEATERVKGLFPSARAAAQSADEALALAERGVFLLHRLPFVIRLQARLAVRQILADSFGRVCRRWLPAVALAALVVAAGIRMLPPAKRHQR